MSPLTPKDLTTKAMLVDLNITQWTGKKYDKKANEAVEDRFQATQKAGRYRKVLAAKDDLAEIKSIISAARDFHIENTRPWIHDGANILPSKNYMHYREKMAEFKSKFEDAVNRVDWVQVKENAKQFLGQLFEDDDYPEPVVIKAKYSFKVSVLPIPSANDFRVTQITDEDIAAIQQQITEQLEEANKLLMRDLYDRLYNVVEKAYETFKDPNARFHDSKLDNIQEVVDVLRRLNMDDDQKLERLCKLAEEKICSLDPVEIRKEPEARQEAATDAKKLLDALAAFN